MNLNIVDIKMLLQAMNEIVESLLYGATIENFTNIRTIWKMVISMKSFHVHSKVVAKKTFHF